MISSINMVTLAGYLGNDPEIKTTQSGKETASFSLATKQKWKDQERTDWHRVVVLNSGLIKLVKSYVRKGSLIGLHGQLQNRSYQDKDGKTCYITEVIIPPFTGALTLLGGQK